MERAAHGHGRRADARLRDPALAALPARRTAAGPGAAPRAGVVLPGVDRALGARLVAGGRALRGRGVRLKFPLAYWCGTRLLDRDFGLLWAAALFVPGWASLEQLVFLNPNAVAAVVLLVLAISIRAWNRPTLASFFALGLALAFAAHVHPTAAPVALLAVPIFVRYRRNGGSLALAAVVFASAFALLFVPYVVSQAMHGFPDLQSAAGYVEHQVALGNVLNAPSILWNYAVAGPAVIARIPGRLVARFGERVGPRDGARLWRGDRVGADCRRAARAAPRARCAGRHRSSSRRGPASCVPRRRSSSPGSWGRPSPRCWRSACGRCGNGARRGRSWRSRWRRSCSAMSPRCARSRCTCATAKAGCHRASWTSRAASPPPSTATSGSRRARMRPWAHCSATRPSR